MDSYSEANQDSAYDIRGGGFEKYFQSFHGQDALITSVDFYVGKTNSPTGNVTASIFAHTGTFGDGSTGKPTGAALATSSAVSAASLGAPALVNFSFGAGYSMSSGTDYCVAIEFSGGDATNTINPYLDFSSPTHVGNGGYYFSGSWTAEPSDLCFYLNGSLNTPISVAWLRA